MLNIKGLIENSTIDKKKITSFFFWVTFIFSLVIVVWLVIKHTIDRAPVTSITVQQTDLNAEQHAQIEAVLLPTKQFHYLTTNLVDIEKAAISMPWVDEVSISRDWHNGITVKILPKQAIARFGSSRLVDAKGNVFYPATTDSLLEKDFVRLQGSADKSLEIMKQMQLINQSFSPLNIVVEDIVLTPRMTWLVRFDSGLRLLVDGDNTVYKIMSASRALKTQLYDKHNDIQSIDLRYKNGFAISWK